MNLSIRSAAGLLAAALAGTAGAQSLTNVSFVNGITIAGNSSDLSGFSGVDSRVGFFSDLYYDASRNEWWGVSDRGPGGGTLDYATRIQRFTIDINATTGAISNFQVQQTILFNNAGTALNGKAPNPAGTLGNAFDPEGVVINPRNGNLLVSDEYGPSLYEFDRSGALLRTYTAPPNLVPQVGSTVDYNSAPPTLTSGREPNRGFEGLAISPDGRYAYAMLQNGAIQDGWSNGNRGEYTRIVKYDTTTGQAVGQYAYQLDRSGQGQGVSSLVALGNDKFLVLERNNRGVGVGATLATADKSVYEINLANATDVSSIALPASGGLPTGVVGVTAASKIKRIDLDANTLAALGNKSPEKWEGIAVGPQLADGRYVILAGTDNDYSVTQNASGTQFDVYFNFSAADPYAASIQCPVGTTTGCVLTSNGNAATLTGAYQLLPGVLHAYVGTIDGYVTPVPEGQGLALAFAGLGVLGTVLRRRRG